MKISVTCWLQRAAVGLDSDSSDLGCVQNSGSIADISMNSHRPILSANLGGTGGRHSPTYTTTAGAKGNRTANGKRFDTANVVAALASDNVLVGIPVWLGHPTHEDNMEEGPACPGGMIDNSASETIGGMTPTMSLYITHRHDTTYPIPLMGRHGQACPDCNNHQWDAFPLPITARMPR